MTFIAVLSQLQVMFLDKSFVDTFLYRLLVRLLQIVFLYQPLMSLLWALGRSCFLNLWFRKLAWFWLCCLLVWSRFLSETLITTLLSTCLIHVRFGIGHFVGVVWLFLFIFGRY